MNRVLMMLLVTAGLVAPVTAAAVLRDPTRPASAAGDSPQARWVLQTTVVSAVRRQAMINGEWLTEGDRIRGATVQHIESNAVTLRHDGKQIQLRMAPAVRQPSALRKEAKQ